MYLAAPTPVCSDRIQAGIHGVCFIHEWTIHVFSDGDIVSVSICLSHNHLLNHQCYSYLQVLRHFSIYLTILPYVSLKFLIIFRGVRHGTHQNYKVLVKNMLRTHWIRTSELYLLLKLITKLQNNHGTTVGGI